MLMKKLILLERLEDTGAIITSLTCDGPTFNFFIMNALEANLNLINLQPSFLHLSNHWTKMYCV